jgi:DNA-binding IclR family transcriptional regulator
MASWPEAELARYLSRPLERNTPQSVVDPEAIRRRLVGIRESGYAWAHEEFAEGLSSVAAPIHGPRRVVVGAITVHGPTYRFPGDADPDRIGALVLGTAARFSASRLAA